MKEGRQRFPALTQEVAMLTALIVAAVIVALYVFAIRAEFFHKSLLYPEHSHPLQYWWDRLVHHRK